MTAAEMTKSACLVVFATVVLPRPDALPQVVSAPTRKFAYSNTITSRNWILEGIRGGRWKTPFGAAVTSISSSSDGSRLLAVELESSRAVAMDLAGDSPLIIPIPTIPAAQIDVSISADGQVGAILDTESNDLFLVRFLPSGCTLEVVAHPPPGFKIIRVSNSGAVLGYAPAGGVHVDILTVDRTAVRFYWRTTGAAFGRYLKSGDIVAAGTGGDIVRIATEGGSVTRLATLDSAPIRGLGTVGDSEQVIVATPSGVTLVGPEGALTSAECPCEPTRLTDVGGGSLFFLGEDRSEAAWFAEMVLGKVKFSFAAEGGRK